MVLQVTCPTKIERKCYGTAEMPFTCITISCSVYFIIILLLIVIMINNNELKLDILYGCYVLLHYPPSLSVVRNWEAREKTFVSWVSIAVWWTWLKCVVLKILKFHEALYITCLLYKPWKNIWAEEFLLSIVCLQSEYK